MEPFDSPTRMVEPDRSGGRCKTVEPNRLHTASSLVLTHLRRGVLVGGSVMTTALAAPKIARETLEDRYTGAMFTRKGTDPGKLQRRLDSVLWDLVAAVARRPTTGEFADGSENPWDNGMVDECEKAIRRIIIDQLDRDGSAR
jgi:hypothetical protein